MKLFTSLLWIALLLIGINYILAAKEASPGAKASSQATLVVNKKDNAVKLFNFMGSQNGSKTMLQWMVNKNEEVNRFEIEKSVDGKNFKTAALIFGSEQSNTDSYMFYEKATDKKLSYRIKLMENNGTISYSDIIVVSPEESSSGSMTALNQ